MADFWRGVAQGFGPAYERTLSRSQRLEDILDERKRQDDILKKKQARDDKLLGEQIKRQQQAATRQDLKDIQKTQTANVRYQRDRDFKIGERDAAAKRFETQEARLSAASKATQESARLAREDAQSKTRRGHLSQIGSTTPEIQAQVIPKGGGMYPSIGDIPWTEDELATAAAKSKRLQTEATAIATEGREKPTDTMSPSQRRIKDLLKVMYPEANDKELAGKEWEHYERQGLSATDKGAKDIGKVFEKWQEASALIDEQKTSGEKPSPDELRQFAVYELEIQDHFGRRGRKVPSALLETMKKVWRFPTTTVEGPVLGAQDIALAGEELVRDLDYLVGSLGQERLDKHVGIWDETEDAIIKKLFPPGTSMTDKEFQAIQSFKQIYSGLSNKTLYLRSGATVTEQEWNRLKKEIGVPNSADFYNRLRTFAKKERRGTRRLLQTRIKARYIFADELQDEIMGGLSPQEVQEEVLPSVPSRNPEAVNPLPQPEASPPLPETTSPPSPAMENFRKDLSLPRIDNPLDKIIRGSMQKNPAAESVVLEELINKGVPNLSPSEKIKLRELLKKQLNN